MYLDNALGLVLGHVAHVGGGVAGPQLVAGHHGACVNIIKTNITVKRQKDLY